MTKSPEATGPVVVTKPARQITILDPAYPYRHAFTVDADGVEKATPAAVLHAEQRVKELSRRNLNRARKLNRKAKNPKRWLTRSFAPQPKISDAAKARIRACEKEKAARARRRLARLVAVPAFGRTQTAGPNESGLLARAAAKIRGLFTYEEDPA